MKNLSGNTAPSEVPTHPLFVREIRPINDWSEFLRLWNATTSYEQMLGLLHIGFEVPLNTGGISEQGFDYTDRLKFYFEIANGWSETDWHWKSPGSEEHPSHLDGITSSSLRKKLATKAFTVLCSEFFNIEKFCSGYRRHHNSDPTIEMHWIQLLMNEHLFPVVKEFFRIEVKNREGSRIQNLSAAWHNGRIHGEERAINALLMLAPFLFNWTETKIESYDYEKEKAEKVERNTAMRAIVDDAMPWMIEVLHDLAGLSVLMPWITDLNEACLSKFKEIAMRSQLSASNQNHHVNNDRQVASLDEARLVGSKAARFLAEYELAMKQTERLIAIQQAEWARDKAGEVITSLSSSK